MMAHQESVTGTGLRTPRAAAGIVFSLLFSLALVLLLLSAPSDTATEGVWQTDASHRATIAVALNLVPFGGIAFLWFIGVVRDRIGQREDLFFASVFLGSGLLFVAMLFFEAAVDGGLIATAAARPAVPGPDTLRMAAVFTFSTVTITLRTKVIPRWIGVLGFAVGVVSCGPDCGAPAARPTQRSTHRHDRAKGGETMISVKPATHPARRHGNMFAVLAIAGLLIADNQASSAHAATA
jgi:hypothetical protein